jgi:hypothetical protein
MSVKSKLLAAAATLALVGGAGTGAAFTAGTAFAATPECGHGCIDIYNPQLGPEFLIDSYKQGQATGTPVILFQSSNDDPALDFTPTDQGTVADFYQAGLVTAAFALHFGCDAGVTFATCSLGADQFNFPALEIQYSPYGAPTGECVGLAATATSGEKVTLQPCGVSAKTVWVYDWLQAQPNFPFGFVKAPLVNGSDTNFSQPFVFTYPSTGYPTNLPRPQLYVSNLSGYQYSIFSDHLDVDSQQLWAAFAGQA